MTFNPIVPIVPQSHWQRGCNDAKAGREYHPPALRTGLRGVVLMHQPDRDSYANGYRFGCQSTGRPLPQALHPLR